MKLILIPEAFKRFGIQHVIHQFLPLLLIFMSHSNSLHASSLPSSAQSLFRQLQSCHLQIFMDPNSYYPQYEILHRLFEYYQGDYLVTYSIRRKYNFPPGGNKKWKNVKHNVLKKARCLSHIYIDGFTWTIFQQNLREIMVQESWPVSPEYAVILTNTDSIRYLFGHLHSLQNSHYLEFSYVVSQMSKVFLINKANSFIVERPEVTDLSVETYLYWKHLNMGFRYIDPDLSEGERGNYFRSCDSTREFGRYRRPPTVEECIFDALSQNFNFSYRVPFGRQYALVKRRIPLSLEYLANEVIPKRRVVVEHGLVFDLWGYLVVKDKLSAYDTGLIGPFGYHIWGAISSCVVGISLLFILVTYLGTTTLSNKSDIVSSFGILETTFRAVTYVFGSLLDQSVNDSMLKFKLYGKTKQIILVLWLVWCFVAFLMANFYKGEMFSCLSKAPEPEYPTTLETLAMSDLMIGTYTGVWHRNEGKPKIMSYLDEVMDGTEYPSYFVNLKHSLKYFEQWLMGVKDLTAQYYVQQLFRYDQNKTFEWEKIPNDFATLDYLKHTEMHRKACILFLNGKWVSPVVKVDSYMSTMPWTVDKNFFYPIFKRGMSQVFESGLYNRWDKNHDSVNGYSLFHWIKDSILEKGFDESDIKTYVPRENWYSYYYHDEIGSRSKQSFESPEQVTVEVLRAIWILLGMMLGFTVVVYVMEIVHGQIFNSDNDVKLFI